MILQTIGFAGTIIGTIAYIPQVISLLKNKNSKGVNIITWTTWLVSTVMILAYALSIHDAVFILVQLLNLVFNLIIVVLIIKYKT
ncbi:MAG: lipid-A-disaccharide synthase N-terminal domain-containing protein [Parcubacteria group bacterium]|nr:lipid-A-disaccharide synthase N-terminal domain-containing protein [Parcubacteria group bacterium]